MKTTWFRNTLFIGLAVLISACTTGPDYRSMPLEEKVVGTWIMPEGSGSMKYVLHGDGRDEWYMAKSDTLPYYWSEFETGATLFGGDDTPWLQVTYYYAEPFAEERAVMGSALLSVSEDGTELYLHWSDGDAMEPEEIPEDPNTLYRQGTPKAEEIGDLPHVSDQIALWYSGPAFLWMMGTNDPETVSDLEAEAETDEEITLVILEWDDFTSSIEDITSEFITIDEFGDRRLIPGLVHILRTREDFPVSLTWNSGLAIANHNYEIVDESYSAYISNPDAYGEDFVLSMLVYGISPEVWLSALFDW